MATKVDKVQGKTHAYRIEDKSLSILDIQTGDTNRVNLSENRGKLLHHIPLEVYHQAVHGKSEPSVVWFDANRDEFQIVK
ncbi:hypothetical protein ACLI4Y_13100 [Natrialbaceae archaeon A-CW3]